jgi:hypothetical protein
MVAVNGGAVLRPRAYHVYNVTSVIQTRQGNVQFPIVSEFDNLYDIWDAITEDGSIYCARLILDRPSETPQHVRRVKGAGEFILGRGGVVTIEPPYYELDPAEVARALDGFDWGGDREGEAA